MLKSQAGKFASIRFLIKIVLSGHPREGGTMPEAALRLDSSWISAFAGMTTSFFVPHKV
ncbi:hypothetical protein [Legionella spiritensis]|uniref:hypothetical protein n=1 Tax=Legionella spiritensis TaxID=452 RepID=UPI0015592FA9|nr:hypothetical protein [Legionella spiritensis]